MIEFILNPIARQLDLVSDATKESFIAGAPVGGQRIVTLNDQGQVIHADHTVAGHAGRICGLTLGSAVAGAAVTVRRFGLVEDSGWQWDLMNGDSFFLFVDGTITQTVPVSGFLCKVGFLVSPTQIFINVEPSITLL